MKTMTDVQKSDADDLPESTARPPTNSSGAARLGLWVLGVGLGGFLLWAGFAPLDEGVPTHGMVTIDTKSKAVQHLSGGIVKAVLVREGDLVKQEQTLIELDVGRNPRDTELDHKIEESLKVAPPQKNKHNNYDPLK